MTKGKKKKADVTHFFFYEIIFTDSQDLPFLGSLWLSGDNGEKGKNTSIEK